MRRLCLLLVIAAAVGVKAAEPVRLLLLRGNCEISFGTPIPVDPILLDKLAAAGFSVEVGRDFQPLTMPYLRQFHVVVWIAPTPYASSFRYYMPAGWQGGTHVLTVRKNAELLQQFVDDGGGLLINPSVEEHGMDTVAAHNEMLAPFGIKTACGQVRDKAQAIEFDKVLKVYPRYMHWSETIASHAVTENVQRIYYPGYYMRWDDNATTLPLYAEDPAWIELVKASPTATLSWFRGTPYEAGHWKDATGRPTPALVAARQFGKGRVAATGIGHFFLYYYPYSKGTHSDGNGHWECNFGYQNGYLLERGDGETPSDLGRLLQNLYGWLAEPAQRLGFGELAEPAVELAAIPEAALDNVAERWAQDDPKVTGSIRPQRILVGARTAYSDGQGTVAQYAAAARRTGYDVIAFTERYEAITDADYERLVADCRRHADDQLQLIPGIDIEDGLGNRFLIVGKDSPVRAHLLAADEAAEPGRQLLWTGHMLLGMGAVLPIAARPQRQAAVRPRGALPPDLYSHCPGVAVATYADGEQVDDGQFAYEWLLFNAAQPIPVAVHEVAAPDQLQQAAVTGLQNYVNSDTPAHAADFFCQGNGSFGGNPMRYYLSSGPKFENARLPWEGSPWALSLQLHSQTDLAQLSIRDQRQLHRRFALSGNHAAVTVYGGLGAQQWLLVEATDSAGGRALLAPIRSLPPRNFIRCMDRQNWFGTLHMSCISYTGRWRSLPDTGFRPAPAVPGVALPAPYCPKLQLTYAGPGYVITDYRCDATLVPGTPDPGADSAPIFNCLPIPQYTADLRYVFHQSVTPPRAISPEYVIQEVAITTKAELTSRGPVWPVIGQVEGQFAGDHPAGAVLDKLLLLTPLRVDADGRLGFACDGDGPVPAGSQWLARVAPLNGKNVADVRRSMGFDGNLPYGLRLDRGTVTSTAMTITATAEDFAIAGRITAGKMPAWWRGSSRYLPLRVSGLNPHWPIGMWRDDQAEIVEYGVLDDVALGRLDAEHDYSFYFGNLVNADTRLHLSFAAPWTAAGGRIEVHNPTDQAITTELSTPALVSNRKACRATVTVAPGSSSIVEF